MHNPAQRLGALRNGAADVKAHPWFSGFDWESFSKMGLKAPYVPKVPSCILLIDCSKHSLVIHRCYGLAAVCVLTSLYM